MVIKALLLILFLGALAWADTGFASTIRVTETDNSPACTVGELKVSTGTLTCSGQIATISTGGSGGGSGSVTNCGSNPAGLQFTDVNSCTWCTTIGTSGNLTTTLVSCPAVVLARPCTSGMPLGLLLSVTCP